MIKDDWRTVPEALELLGEGWYHSDEGPSKAGHIYSKDGCSRIRVYDGTEHPLAQKNMVIVNTKPFQDRVK